MASHLASLWKWDFLELGNGLLQVMRYYYQQNVFTHVASIYGKFIGTKESVYIRKELNSHKNCSEHQHGRHFIT